MPWPVDSKQYERTVPVLRWAVFFTVDRIHATLDSILQTDDTALDRIFFDTDSNLTALERISSMRTVISLHWIVFSLKGTVISLHWIVFLRCGQ
ncbi:hypothetical protein ACFSCZ_05220 [Siminovitchia sediminis]|uniref:Uncharacterized protein n=1 Tax=Siminovitchia sediminis TaxID=1274353 RepID=A0ABW4KF43_9BACI